MFCEYCGKTIADTAAACPHCGQATGASRAPTVAPAATIAARSSRGAATKQERSLLSHAEKAVYFRLARGFSWFLLILLTLGLVMSAIPLVPALSQSLGSSISVGPKDLVRALASPSVLRSDSDEGEPDLNPAEMAQLDQVAYEIISLLPAESKSGGIVDSLRGQIRGLASNLSNERKIQLAFLQELRDDLREVPASQRLQAINLYSAVKLRRIQQDQATREAAQRKLVLYGSSVVSAIALLTLVTMILVLLSIERNTRVSPG
jgi:hypothetical protein